MIEISCEAQKALEILLKNGFEAFVVGGYVRDVIMGKDSNDVDITTNALPLQIENCFSSYRVIETGIKHGTVTVIINKQPVEITTYRKESTYSDNRHPDKVEFCTALESDLSRRDFTVNALAYNHETGIVDMFSGRKDIENKIIRAIGNAKERFNEDSLRILRALRFSSVLGFEIEKGTSAAIHECKDLIKNVANERIATELRKMLCGKNIKKILLDYFDVFEIILPELKDTKGFLQHNFHHKYDVYEHIATVVENAPATDYMRLAALFHDCAKPECFSLDENGVGHFYSHASKSAESAKEALKRLRFDNQTVKRVETLVKQHDSPIEEKSGIIKRKLNKFGEEMLFDLIALQRADTLGLADEFHSRLSHFERLHSLTAEILSERQCFSVKDLAINGNDIKLLGFSGREIGFILESLVSAVIDSKVNNEKDELLNYVSCLNI